MTDMPMLGKIRCVGLDSGDLTLQDQFLHAAFTLEGIVYED